MALMGGHRFAVSMAEAFPHGLYAMGVEQAQDYNERTGKRTPARDKQNGDQYVWTITCIDRDPEARVKEVRIKVTGPHMPVLPDEVLPGSGLRPVEFTGMTVTPYVEDGRGGGRSRLAFSFRASGVHTPGKAPAGSTTSGSGSGRSGGQASGDGKAA
jgi:hypothetical protein